MPLTLFVPTPLRKQVAWWPLRELDKANKKAPRETQSDAFIEEGTCNAPAEEGVTGAKGAPVENGVAGAGDNHGPGDDSSAPGIQEPARNGDRVPLETVEVVEADGEDEDTMSDLTQPLLTSAAPGWER